MEGCPDCKRDSYIQCWDCSTETWVGEEVNSQRQVQATHSSGLDAAGMHAVRKELDLLSNPNWSASCLALPRVLMTAWWQFNYHFQESGMPHLSVSISQSWQTLRIPRKHFTKTSSQWLLQCPALINSLFWMISVQGLAETAHWWGRSIGDKRHRQLQQQWHYATGNLYCT